MKERIAQLESELEQTRKVANVERKSTADRKHLTGADSPPRLKTLEEENTRLKSDLATFESLAGEPGGESGLAISRLQIVPEGGGQYRYRLLLAQTGDKKDKEFNGMLQLRRHRAARQGDCYDAVSRCWRSRRRCQYQVSFPLLPAPGRYIQGGADARFSV
jgi:hypothetical protein